MNPVITIRRDGCTVSIGYNVNRSIEMPIILFNRTHQTEADACIVEDYVREGLEQMVKNIREQAYLEGWNDKRKKKSKIPHLNFSSFIGLGNMCGWR